MSAVIRPIADFDHSTREILDRELGIVDALRFVSQFRPGTGDHTVERGKWLDELTLNDIVSEIKAKRRKARRSNG